MKLFAAKIINFRSISEIFLKFTHGCVVLVGINESGKSNILKALQLLDSAVSVSTDDLRIERPEENQVTKGRVEFHFEADEDEIERIYEKVSKNFDVPSLERALLSIPVPVGPKTLKEYCIQRSKASYEVEIPTDDRKILGWAVPKSHKIQTGWRVITASDYSIKRSNGMDSHVPQKTIIHLQEKDSIEGTEEITPEKINALIYEAFLDIFKKNMPKCIFWKYSEEYLLPSSVIVDEFSADPDSCVPLKSMFELAGYKGADIAAALTSVRAQAPHRYFALLRRVSQKATEHIRAVWRDHDSVRIDLRSDGNLIIPLISDKDLSINMSSRSDGFKRIVSFLLQISAKVLTSELSNVLILVDEPEIALHPGGAKNLMAELIKIGRINPVVYSTHSIFMIDRENISRHLIIEKQNEVTIAKVAEKSRIQDEQVLYAAMGYSIFETLREKNVIFEGWRDKEIFRVASDAMGKSNLAHKKEMERIGSTFAEGVKDIKNVARFLELANRGCLIISDADNAAFSRKKEYEKPGAWGSWLTLTDILGTASISTGEDLLTRKSVIERANNFRSQVDGLALFGDGDFREGEYTLSALKRWVSKAGATGDAFDSQINDLKTALYENLRRDELSDLVDQIVEYVRAYNFKLH